MVKNYCGELSNISIDGTPKDGHLDQWHQQGKHDCHAVAARVDKLFVDNGGDSAQWIHSAAPDSAVSH
ncbi:hypothetical protein CCP3SC1_340030 [Gammaproteobacteria bacterium]